MKTKEKTNWYRELKHKLSDKIGEINDLEYHIKELEDENKELSEQLEDVKRSL